MRSSMITLGGLLLAAATPAMAEDAPSTAPEAAAPTAVADEAEAPAAAVVADEPEAAPDAITVSGSVTAISDYRFRGISQTGKDPALQAGVTVSHESGLYGSIWASTIDDDDAFAVLGYGKAEIDLSAGYAKTFDNGVGIDVGLLYYLYPIDEAGFDTDFFEPYATVSYTAGPITAKLGANWAWGGQSGLLGNDSLYLRGDLSVAIPKTPVTVLAHVGHTDGQLAFFDPNGKYLDWSLGVEATHDFIKVGVQYVDTDVTSAVVPIIGRYDKFIGASPTVVGYVTFSF